MWNLAKSKLHLCWTAHTKGVRSCCTTTINQGTKNVAVSCSADMTLAVWDLDAILAAEPGTVVVKSDDDESDEWPYRLNVMNGHTDWVNACVTFQNEGGLRVLSCSDDKTLKVWRLENSASEVHLQSTLRGHHGWVLGCDVTADGRWAVSVSNDKTLRVWRLDGSAECAEMVAGRRTFANGASAVAVVPPCFAFGDFPVAVGFFDGSVKLSDCSNFESTPCAGALWAAYAHFDHSKWRDWLAQLMSSQEHFCYFLYLQRRKTDGQTIIHQLAQAPDGFAALLQIFEASRRLEIQDDGAGSTVKLHGLSGLLSHAGRTSYGNGSSAMDLAIEHRRENVTTLLGRDYIQYIDDLHDLCSRPSATKNFVYLNLINVDLISESTLMQWWRTFPHSAAAFLLELKLRPTAFITSGCHCNFSSASSSGGCFFRESSDATDLRGHTWWDETLDDEWNKTRARGYSGTSLRVNK